MSRKQQQGKNQSASAAALKTPHSSSSLYVSDDDLDGVQSSVIKSKSFEDCVAVHVYTGESGDGVQEIIDATAAVQLSDGEFDDDSFDAIDGLDPLDQLMASEPKAKRKSKSRFDRNFGDSDGEDTGYDFSETQNYFMAHASRTKTSANTLRDIDLTALRNISSGSINYLESDKLQGTVMESYEKRLFAEFYFLLYEGANVITYGFGSKKKLLERFTGKWLVDEFSFIIYGFFPEITVKHILGNLQEALEAEDASLESLLEAAAVLNHDIYLVIHSLDVLLSSSSQKLKQALIDVLTMSDGKIHLIASVDHVHSGLLFNSTETNQLNLVWISCPTMESYLIERGYGSSGGSKNGALMGQVSLSSIEHVYESLNPNAQKIFMQILGYYLNRSNNADDIDQMTDSPAEVSTESDTPNDDSEEDEPDVRPGRKKSKLKKRSKESESEGLLPFSTLYRMCREEYLVNSEITLKAQLTEFKDHKLIKFNKRSDGTQTINLLVNLQLAQKFVEKVLETL